MTHCLLLFCLLFSWVAYAPTPKSDSGRCRDEIANASGVAEASPQAIILRDRGYTDVHRLYGDATGAVYTGSDANGRHHIFKFDRANFLSAEFELLNRLKKLDDGAQYFPKVTAIVTTTAGIYLPMTMFPKNPNRFSPANDLPAPTLRERIDDGSLTEDMKIKIVRQLVSAVGKLHEADIIHRDLKPGNILVDDLGNIQIIDFGLSADAGHQPNAFGGLVRSDSGTPPYMSPGQMRGEPALSPQDVFALGRTFNDLFRPRVRPGDKIPEGAFQRVKPQENFSPHIIDWWAADENLSNKALAVVLQEYRSSSIDDYQLGIKKATTLSEKEFLLWYGKRLSDLGAERYQDVRSGTFLKKPYAANVEGARLILGSKFLVNQFQKGMGLTATEQKALQAGIEVLRERYRGYYDRKGNRVEKAVSVFDEVPYYYFREFDRVNGSWWGRMFR